MKSVLCDINGAHCRSDMTLYLSPILTIIAVGSHPGAAIFLGNRMT